MPLSKFVDVIGLVAAMVMFGLGALHVYWAAGGRWGSAVAVPSRGEDLRLFSPRPGATLIVAALLFAAALVMLGRLGIWGQWFPRWFFLAGSWTIAIVFAARVLGDFRWFGLFKQVADTSFAWWDSRLYVPLCAMLALAAALMAINR
jgi:hypothetical protein